MAALVTAITEFGNLGRLPVPNPCGFGIGRGRARQAQCGLVISMGLKLPPDQLALYRGIDEIMWRDWDPIGVSRWESAPRDEYQGYVPQVFHLALQAAPATEIAEYLRQVTVERISLSASLETELPVAEKIRALKLDLMPE